MRKRTKCFIRFAKGYVIHTHTVKSHFVYTRKHPKVLWDPLSALQSAGKRTPQRRHHNGYRWDTILHKCEDALQPCLSCDICCLLFGFLFLFASLASVEQYIFSPQCAGKDVKALVDTGCQYNLISSACVDRLG